MNPTLARFDHPKATVFEYRHWVVLIRPAQPTPLCCVIAARSNAQSLGTLTPEEAAELPMVINHFESVVTGIAPARKFNYLALMMVDPNPHFHAIPRYDQPVQLGEAQYRDEHYPRPPDMLQGLAVDAATLESWRARLTEGFSEIAARTAR